MNESIEDEGYRKRKQSLFDLQLVCEMIVAGIILYIEEKQQTIDENDVADFVIEHFPQILNSITEWKEIMIEKGDYVVESKLMTYIIITYEYN